MSNNAVLDAEHEPVGKPWNASTRFVIAVIVFRSAGSDKYRSNTIVRNTRPSSLNARYSRFLRESWPTQQSDRGDPAGPDGDRGAQQVRPMLL
jgi:hypothetical protein